MTGGGSLSSEEIARRRLGNEEFELMPALVRWLCQDFEEGEIDQAYLSGAVADPTCKAHHIGAAGRAGGQDDLDLVVTLDGWEWPPINSAIVYVVLPAALRRRAPLASTLGEPEWHNEHWDCSASEAWERLPRPAQKALERSTRYTTKYEGALFGPAEWAAGGPLDLHFASREHFFEVNDPDRRVRVYPPPKA